MKEIDDCNTSSLTYSEHRYRIHRDYLAHCFRWGWATKFINERGSKTDHGGHRRVLEAGCGKDAPLCQSLMRSSGPDKRPEFYLGVDLDVIPYVRERRGTSDRYELIEEFNFVERWRELFARFGPTFDLAVSFEVIEHMAEEHGTTYLWAINALLEPEGTLLISTPACNGRMARDHIREYTIEELQTKLEACGFHVVDRFGTFANKPDVVKGLRALYPEEAPALLAVYERCRDFYGDDVLASFLAPLVPDYSRNNVWVCEKAFEPWADR